MLLETICNYSVKYWGPLNEKKKFTEKTFDLDMIFPAFT